MQKIAYWSKRKSQEDLEKYFELNDNGNTTYQIAWAAAKTIFSFKY